MSKQEFIDLLWVEASKAKKLGAPISVPVVVAQAAIESGWGDSELSRTCNNYFGIKGTYQGQSCTRRTAEQDADGGVYYIDAAFRAYDSISECFLDYGDIIRRLSWYQDAEDAAHVPEDFLKGLATKRDEFGGVVEPGWATDHDYFGKVWGVVEQYNLLDRVEDPPNGVDFVLVQVYEGTNRYDYKPLKITVGTTKDGDPKLMIRVKPKSFWQRLKELFLGTHDETPEPQNQPTD